MQDEKLHVMLQVVKKMKVNLKVRVVPPDTVQKWAVRLEELEPDVRRLNQVGSSA